LEFVEELRYRQWVTSEHAKLDPEDLDLN